MQNAGVFLVSTITEEVVVKEKGQMGASICCPPA